MDIYPYVVIAGSGNASIVKGTSETRSSGSDGGVPIFRSGADNRGSLQERLKGIGAGACPKQGTESGVLCHLLAILGVWCLNRETAGLVLGHPSLASLGIMSSRLGL